MTVKDMKLPANLPSTADARLPERYEAAKAELAACAEVDECQDWADKMAALASYARQADDDELETFARRVRARAIRRCGELLKEIEPDKGGRPAKTHAPEDISLSRSQAARDAGLSEKQKNTALRVANVPQEDFEEAVESPKPATVTELSERGTKKKPKPLVDLKGRDPADFKLATQIGGSIRYFAEELADADPAAVARGLFPEDHADLRQSVTAISDWLRRLIEELENGNVV